MSPIAYQLTLHIPNPIRVSVGQLGTWTFPAGYYVYTGSAKRNMEARLERHLKKNKKLHWHIDYLTTHSEVQIVHLNRSDQHECRLNQFAGGMVIADGFGASDCHHGCGSHLRYIGESWVANVP